MWNFIRFLLRITAIGCRRSYLNQSYKTNPKTTTAKVFKRFEVFLGSGQSPLSKNYFGPAGQALGAVTVAGYMRMLKKLVRDMNAIVPTKEQALEHIMKLKHENKSYSHRLNSRNLMLHWCYFHGFHVELPRDRKPLRVLKNIPSIEDVKNLLSVAKTEREKALLLTLIRTGLRVSELSHLTTRDIDFENKQITVVQGKNSKDRIVNVTMDCLEALKVYLAKKKPKENEAIFSKPQIIRRTLRRITKRTSVTGRTHPHAFRHAYATHAIYQGLDLITIQHQLGHSSALTTSRVYINMTEAQRKQKYEEFAPTYEVPKIHDVNIHEPATPIQPS